ncbi:interleukin 17-like protein [Gigantopelta aegis]|uniref:interleukin 17-like protein n=1 Tax=Gigantopelta aegis TaxID=1735272 RepID=UPI001B88CFA2|nr:interleukin 17-like protein [Gigantopelta aegis]
MIMMMMMVMVMMMAIPVSESAPCHCADPPDILLLKSENMDEMVFRWLQEAGLTNLSHTPESDYSVLLEKVASSTLLGVKDCPSRRGHPLGTKDYQRAICPWHYVLDIDDDRVPRVMVHAQCSCEKCRFLSGRHSGSCMPIYQARQVQRRVRCKEDGFYEYVDFKEQVPVGCACVRAAISPSRTSMHSPP